MIRRMQYLPDIHDEPLLPLTEYHRQRRVKYLCHLIIRGDTEPGTRITFDPVTLVPIDHGKQRVGQPRLNQDVYEIVWLKNDDNDQNNAIFT